MNKCIACCKQWCDYDNSYCILYTIAFYTFIDYCSLLLRMIRLICLKCLLKVK